MPPPRFGSASVASVFGSVMRPMSESATYATDRSAAEPHWTPPIVPPSPTFTDHSTFPSASGSRPCTMPDFCPATITRFPLAIVTRMGDELKSKSGPVISAQFVLSGRRHPTIQESDRYICRDHLTLPVSRSNATIASLVREGGSLKLLPVPTYSALRRTSIVGAFHTEAPDGPQSWV